MWYIQISIIDHQINCFAGIWNFPWSQVDDHDVSIDRIWSGGCFNPTNADGQWSKTGRQLIGHGNTISIYNVVVACCSLKIQYFKIRYSTNIENVPSATTHTIKLHLFHTKLTSRNPISPLRIQLCAQEWCWYPGNQMSCFPSDLDVGCLKQKVPWYGFS